MKLWLVRHGYAGMSVPDPAKERARPLTATGAAQVRAVAMRLNVLGEIPTVIYHSPLQRAQDTAYIFANVMQCTAQSFDNLSPYTPCDDVIKLFARYPDIKRVMLVGHHDNLEPAIAELTGAKCDPIMTAEARRFRLDRDSLSLDERFRLRPGDLGMQNYIAQG